MSTEQRESNEDSGGGHSEGGACVRSAGPVKSKISPYLTISGGTRAVSLIFKVVIQRIQGDLTG
jgi:hypothetical protein